MAPPPIVIARFGILASFLATIVAKFTVDFIVTIRATVIADVNDGLGVGLAHDSVDVARGPVGVAVGAVLSVKPQRFVCAGGVGVGAPVGGAKIGLENDIVLTCPTLAGKIIRAHVWRQWRRGRVAALAEEIRLSGFLGSALLAHLAIPLDGHRHAQPLITLFAYRQEQARRRWFSHAKLDSARSDSL